MSSQPACESFIPMLSPFIDGELTATDRQNVERHLSACSDCTGRVADLRAESGLIRHAMEMLADEADFSSFSQKVMARVTPERPALLERAWIYVSEMFTYQRATFATAALTAAVVLAIAVPLLMRQAVPPGYASKQFVVESVVSEDENKVAPVVFKTESGDPIIWFVGNEEKVKDEAASEEMEMAPTDGAPAPLQEQRRPEGGEL